MVTPGTSLCMYSAIFSVLQRRDADQDVDLVQNVALGQFIEPDFQAIRVIDQVGLEELRPGVDLLVLAHRLKFRPRGKRRGRRAEKHLRRVFDLAAIEVVTFVAHAARYPQHLHRVEIDDSLRPIGAGPIRPLSPERHSMLRMPSALAPITSDCRLVRVRSRAAICITGSAPF